MRRGAVAAYRDENFAVAAEHMHRDVVALLSAGFERRLRNRHRHSSRHALLGKQLCSRGRGQRAEKTDHCEATGYRTHAGPSRGANCPPAAGMRYAVEAYHI